jgi:hypothetical protein
MIVEDESIKVLLLTMTDKVTCNRERMYSSVAAMVGILSVIAGLLLYCIMQRFVAECTPKKYSNAEFARHMIRSLNTIY